MKMVKGLSFEVTAVERLGRRNVWSLTLTKHTFCAFGGLLALPALVLMEPHDKNLVLI